jgi:MinD superfamily P-loop ATPase
MQSSKGFMNLKAKRRRGRVDLKKDKKTMKELVVVSGKGGTGKTSLVASFAVLAGRKVLADCDVDAADLHLILKPQIRRREIFKAGRQAVIRELNCSGCGKCLEHCRFEAVKKIETDLGKERFSIDPISCEGCGVCVQICPEKAIDFPEKVCGEWFVSDTRCGPMVHARLNPAAENSGKLVSLVRTQAREIAEKEGMPLVIIDGSPGIGCPVIASITAASLVLVVSEPTLSGEHDFKRVLALSEHFHLPTALCINKFDLNPSMAEQIEKEAKSRGVSIAGRIRYDRLVTTAQVEGKAVVEYDQSLAGEDIKAVWNKLGLN